MEDWLNAEDVNHAERKRAQAQSYLDDQVEDDVPVGIERQELRQPAPRINRRDRGDDQEQEEAVMEGLKVSIADFTLKGHCVICVYVCMELTHLLLLI